MRALGDSIPAQQRVTRLAREHAEATATVEHAHRRPVRVAQRGGQRLGQQTRTRRLLAPVDHQRRGQPRASTSGGSASTAPSASASASTVGAGDTTDHDAPARRARSYEHVACVPRGRPLFLQRLVGVVDDDRGREIGNGRERGRSARPPRRSRPRAARRHASVRAASDSSECTSATVATGAGADTARATARDPSATATSVEPSVARTSTRPAPADRATAAAAPPLPRTGVSDAIAGAAEPRRFAGSAGSGVGATRFGRGGGAQDCDPRARPAPGDPVGEVDHVRRAAGGRDREDLEQPFRACRRCTSSATTQPRTRRPCSGTRTIAPTRISGASASGTM